jgi:hypothetical protein
VDRIALDPAAPCADARYQQDLGAIVGTIMDRMHPIVVDPVVSRYIEAARKNRHETANEILRRLLKLDEIPSPAPGEIVIALPKIGRSTGRRR